jgi:hypothetical protein
MAMTEWKNMHTKLHGKDYKLPAVFDVVKEPQGIGVSFDALVYAALQQLKN